MAEELKVAIGIELRDGELNKIQSEIKNIGNNNKIKLEIDSGNIVKQLNEIKSQIQSISKIKIDFNSGSNSGNKTISNIKNIVKETEYAYKQLLDIQRSISKLEINVAKTDSSKNPKLFAELSSQLQKFKADYETVKSTLMKGDFSTEQWSQLAKVIDETELKISQLNAKMADSNGMKNIQADFKEIYNLAKEISSLEIKIGGLNGNSNSNEINVLTKQLQTLKTTYNELMSSFASKLNTNYLNVGDLQQLNKVFYDTENKLSQLEAKIADAKAKMATGIQTNIDNGSVSAAISKVTAEYEKLGTTGHEKLSQIKADIASLNSIQAEMKSGNLSTEEMITKWNEYETTLQRVRNSLSTVKSETSQLASALQVQHLDNQMKTWLENNTKSAAEFGGAIAKLRAELAALNGNGNGSVNLNAFQDIKNRFKGIKEQAASAGTLGKTFFSSFGSGFKSIASMYLSPIMLFMQGVSKVKEMYQNVKDIDKAMTGLRRVTTLSEDEYTTLYDNMRQSAQSYGATLTDVVDSTTTWVKLGFDANTSNKLAETTVEYQHVTDLDSETAVKNLVTAYKGFQEQLDDVSGGDTSKAVEYVADIYDKLGNEFAVSAANVGSGLTECASTLSLAGNTIEQSAAMVTGITEVTQNPDKAGNALKILSLRLRGMKGDLEELGEDVDENVESISKMQTQVLNLTHGKVNIFDDNGNFKSTYKIMKGIAEVYDTLSDTEQAELLETIAGKNRANDIASLITNWKQVEEACKAAYNSEGTAAQENAKYLESIEGRINQLKSAWQGLSADFLSADFVKGSVDGLRNIVSGIDALTNSIGAIPTLLGGIAAFAGLKTLFKTIGDKGGLAYLLKTVSALPTPVKVAAVAITGLAIAGKKLYENWYNNNFKWSEGLTEVADKATASYDKVKSLSDLKKEIGKLDLVIKSDKSSIADITQAQQRLQEISQLVKDEYGITVTADTSRLDAAINKFEKLQLSEARGNQNTLDNNLSSKVAKYNESTDKFPELEKQFLETQDKATRYNKALSKFGELMDTYSNRISNDKSMEEWVKTTNEWLDYYGIDKESVGRLSENENNALVESMLEKYAKKYQDDVAEENDHNLKAQYDDLKGSIDEFEASRDKFIQNGLTELSMGDEAEGIKQLTSAVQDYGASAEEVAMSASKAKYGIESFTELNGDVERINQAIESYSNYAKQFGATSEEVAEGSALIANGFDSAETAVAAGDEAISNVLSDMKRFGENNGLFEGMDTDGISAKLTEMAQAMDLLPDTKHIEIDAEGNINVIDDIKNKIDELDSKGAIKLSVNADGDISVIDSIDQKLVNLSKAGQIDIKFNVDTGGFDINDLQGNNLGEITASGEVVWKSDTSQVEAPNTEPVNVSVNYTKGDQAPPDNKDANVNYNLGTQAPPDNGNANVDYALGYQAPPENKIAAVTYVSSGDGTVDGTAHVNGTTNTAYIRGTAFAQGDWGTKTSGTALGGELGREILVRNGKWFTIGDNGAEFFGYKKGDIIFNAEQTKQILEKGKIIHGKRRGKALVDGTAFANGTVNSRLAFAEGSKDSENKPEYFDWIEVAVDRLERVIKELDSQMDDTFTTFEKRNKALMQKTPLVKQEIEWQQQAYDRYINQAESIGLSDEWIDKIKDGTLDIDAITDDTLKENIQQYREWYEKALDCKDAIIDLRQEVKNLHKEAFENVSKEYDNILSTFEHQANILNEQFERAQERGLMDSTRYYEALKNNENKSLVNLTQERNALIEKLNQAVNAGEVEVYSETWYELKNEIDDVTESIEESRTALKEFDNEMRQITWDRFDYAIDKVSQLTDESDFLIDLLSHNDLYDTDGDLTKYGKATMGLHGVNYNTYMEEALAYGEAIKQIDNELSKNPNDINLLERRQELLELQRENILAAEDEKDSIVDLINNGIDEELNSLQSLIDSYTDALDAEKDLYDYREKIADKTKEIASIQKQLAAYENDTSEETKATIQKLKVELEDSQKDLRDMEYDQYIKDQKALLEDLYTQYESILHEQTNDVDVLISDAIDTINDNASGIKSTLTSATEEVGTSLSDNMNRIWTDGKTAIKDYSKISSGFYSKVDGYFATGYPTKPTGLQVGIENILSGINSLIYHASGISDKLINPEKFQAMMKENSLNWYTSDSQGQKALSSQNTQLADYLGLWKGDDGWHDEENDNLFYSVNDTEKIEHMVSAMKENSAAWATANTTQRANLEAANNRMANYIADISGERVYKDGDGIWWIGSNQLYEAYKNGVYNLNKDQLAWTQENGEEIIIRPSDGAVLTPLSRGDSVLSSKASANLYDFANNPTDFIQTFTRNISTGTPTVRNGITYDGDINFEITLPNVMNYEQFKYAMQHDSNFEKMIKSMTIDRLTGGSSLKKYKY